MDEDQSKPEKFILGSSLPKEATAGFILFLVLFIFSGYMLLKGQRDLQYILMFGSLTIIGCVIPFGLPLSFKIIANSKAGTLELKRRSFFRSISKIYQRKDVREIYFQVDEKARLSQHNSVLLLENGDKIYLDYGFISNNTFIGPILPASFQDSIYKKEENIRKLARFLDIPIGNAKALLTPSYPFIKGYEYEDKIKANNPTENLL